MRELFLPSGAGPQKSDCGLQGGPAQGRGESFAGGGSGTRWGEQRVQKERLEARLGLAKYNADAPLLADDWWKKDGHIRKVKILLGQHIGAPAIPVVEKGTQVKVGDCIARPAEGLSVGIHASLDGVVQEVTDGFVIIAER